MFPNDDAYKEEDDDLTQEAVSRFEDMLAHRRSQYFDAEEFELIIDYYMQRDDLRRSRQAVDLAVEQHPDDSILRVKYARQYLVENRPEKALQLLKETDFDRDDPDYYLTLGSCYAALGQPQTAIDTYMKALPYFEEDEKSELYHAIGFAYQDLYDYRKAIPYFKKSLDTATDPVFFGNTMAELSNCYVDGNAIDEGIRYLNERIERDPHEVEAWSALGDIYRLTDQLEQAIDMYEFALAIDPTHFWSNLHLSNAYYDLNRFQEAVDSLHEALSHQVDTPMIRTSLGDCHYRMGQFIDAKNEYLTALQGDERLADAWSGLGYIYSDTGDSTRAVKCFQKAYSLEPFNDDHLYNLASEYWKVNEREKALECLLEVEKKQPDDVDLYFCLGDLLADMDRYEEAYYYLQLGLERTHDDPTLHYLLAFLHLERGERLQAFHDLELGLNADPSYYKEFLDYNPEMLKNDVEVMELIKKKVMDDKQ